MDNLPPTPQIEIEDAIVRVVNTWNKRSRLTALKYLYTLCQVRIADLNHEIAEELRREIKEKSPSVS